MAPCDTVTERMNALCEALLEGFHVAAQPLTMILAALSADCTALMPEAELRELTETCSHEAERLARTFRSLKRLVQSYHFPPKLGDVVLTEVLKSRISDSAPNAEGRPIPVRLQLGAGSLGVLADREATADLLQTLVEAAAAYSETDDPILVACAQAGETVRVTISSQSPSLNRLPGELKIALPLATARMETQKGTASWRTSPFAVELSFPV